MEYTILLQKLCQIETRRLFLVMGIVASFVLLILSSALPYGNVLLSLFPAGKLPVLGKSSFPTGDSSPSSVIVGDISLLNASDSSALSAVPGVVNDTEASNMVDREKLEQNEKEGEDRNLTNDRALEKDRGPDNAFELDEDRKLDNESSSRKVVDLDNNSTLENARMLDNASTLEKSAQSELSFSNGQVRNNFSSDNVLKEYSGMTLEKVGSSDTGFVPSPPMLPPVTSSGKQPTEMLSKDEKYELLHSRHTSASNNSKITNNPIKEVCNILPKSITSIAEMNHLLLRSRASSCSKRSQWSSVHDEELLSVKSQIEKAPIIKNDQELYAPIFRNVSMFKRSYELMEQTLKVYVYREGGKPIFHQPVLKGIYASEGWFMRLMEANRQFVVKNPRKANLFYLPFSTRMLEETLYVPNSHSRKNLIEYLKKYVDTIAAKYPFWNRTGGADHFLVACHDWAPSETERHMALCIRALCNADVTEGFKIGKDVSLPETYVRSAQNPLRDLGGKPPSKRPFLAFFAGNMHGYLRPILLQYWENKDPDMKIFGRMGRGSKSKMNYIQHMKSSKYCICAKGYEVNSPRVVEAIFYECVPVIISDNFVPPFFEVLDWEAFALFVPEKDIPKLKDILLSIPEKKYRMMQQSVKKVQQHFLWHNKPVKYDIFHMILHSVWYNRVFQMRLR